MYKIWLWITIIVLVFRTAVIAVIKYKAQKNQHIKESGIILKVCVCFLSMYSQGLNLQTFTKNSTFLAVFHCI